MYTFSLYVKQTCQTNNWILYASVCNTDERNLRLANREPKLFTCVELLYFFLWMSIEGEENKRNIFGTNHKPNPWLQIICCFPFLIYFIFFSFGISFIWVLNLMCYSLLLIYVYVFGGLDLLALLFHYYD